MWLVVVRTNTQSRHFKCVHARVCVCRLVEGENSVSCNGGIYIIRLKTSYLFPILKLCKSHESHLLMCLISCPVCCKAMKRNHLSGLISDLISLIFIV